MRLKAVPKEKDLRTLFNNKLTFEQHSAKVNKANSLVGMLQRTFFHLRYIGDMIEVYKLSCDFYDKTADNLLDLNMLIHK